MKGKDAARISAATITVLIAACSKAKAKASSIVSTKSIVSHGISMLNKIHNISTGQFSNMRRRQLHTRLRMKQRMFQHKCRA